MRISDWSSDVCSSDLLWGSDTLSGGAQAKAGTFALADQDNHAGSDDEGHYNEAGNDEINAGHGENEVGGDAQAMGTASECVANARSTNQEAGQQGTDAAQERSKAEWTDEESPGDAKRSAPPTWPATTSSCPGTVSTWGPATPRPWQRTRSPSPRRARTTTPAATRATRPAMTRSMPAGTTTASPATPRRSPTATRSRTPSTRPKAPTARPATT